LSDAMTIAAEETRALILRLCAQSERPVTVTLAGMQLELAYAMAHVVGGPLAAIALEDAADRVRCVPSLKAQSMAFRGADLA
jgi:hypothetical protein